MCGIAGAVAFRDGGRPDRDRLCTMAGLMAHRGPDGEGFWADPRGRVALAHRRLSIIDIAGGRQPMCSDDGQTALVFNGEIYNYRELRRSLSDEGVAVPYRVGYRSAAADVRAIRQRGGALSPGHVRVRGLGREAGRAGAGARSGGQEALVLRAGRGLLLLSPRPCGPQDTDPRTRRVHLEALDAFLTLGYVPAPQSIWDGISKLPAGTLLRVSSSGARSSAIGRSRAPCNPSRGASPMPSIDWKTC